MAFNLIYHILPYFTQVILIQATSWGAATNLGLRAKPRGDGTVANLGRPRLGDRPHLGNGVTLTDRASTPKCPIRQGGVG